MQVAGCAGGGNEGRFAGCSGAFPQRLVDCCYCWRGDCPSAFQATLSGIEVCYNCISASSGLCGSSGWATGQITGVSYESVFLLHCTSQLDPDACIYDSDLIGRIYATCWDSEITPCSGFSEAREIELRARLEVRRVGAQTWSAFGINWIFNDALRQLNPCPNGANFSGDIWGEFFCSPTAIQPRLFQGGIAVLEPA